MRIFGRILCPVDFDDNSFAALRLAGQLAERDQATLYLMHVVKVVEEMVSAAPSTFEQGEQAAHAQLQKAAESQLARSDYQVILRHGNPAEQIVAAQNELGAELVVMATHGRTGFSHLLLGSVAERVLRESPCPVLTVRMGLSQPKQA